MVILRTAGFIISFYKGKGTTSTVKTYSQNIFFQKKKEKKNLKLNTGIKEKKTEYFKN